MKKYQFTKIMFIFILALISMCIPSYANEIQDEQIIREYSYDYKKWLELPDWKKESTIAPAMYTIPLDRRDIYNKTIQEMILKGEGISSSYILETEIPISDQGETNICWAYVSNLVLQTSVQKMLRPNEEQPNYSEKHLDYSTSAVLSATGIEDNRNILNPNGVYRNTNSGGNIYYSLGYWISGRGPILESYMPYNNTNPMSSVNELNVAEIDVQVNGSIDFATIYKRHNSDNTITYGSGSDFSTTYTEELVNNNRNNIKSHIMNNGAIYAGIYMDSTEDRNYLSSSYAYINKYDYVANHGITIIGWDDNYPVANFPENNQPNNPGAWICANSWGVNWGDNGIFYISYEDVLVESYLIGVTNISEVDYEHIYQHEQANKSGGYNFRRSSVWSKCFYKKF